MLILSNAAMAQMREGGNYQQPGPKGPESSQVSKQAQGSGGAIVAKQITPEEAAKKYPAAKGKYPMGERDPHKSSKEILINLLALSTVHIRLTPSLIVRRFRTMGSFSIPA